MDASGVATRTIFPALEAGTDELLPGARAKQRIRWVMADEADRAELDAWCAVVGPPVLAAADRSTENAIDSLLAVSWNVHVGGGDLIRFVDDLRAGRLTGEPVQHFVLLLQEVHREGPKLPAAGPGRVPRRIESRPETGKRLDIIEAARRLSLNLFYAPSMRNGDEDGSAAEDRGNAILASLPLTEPRAIELPYEAQRRVSVAARVDGVTTAGAAWELQVASVHFDTRSRLSRLFASLGTARLRQAEGLVEALPPAAASVVGGDLNTWSPRALEPAIPYLLDHFPATPEQGAPTFTVGELISRQLDYLLFRLPAPHAARVWREDSRYGSDHYPLLGWIHFG